MFSFFMGNIDTDAKTGVLTLGGVNETHYEGMLPRLTRCVFLAFNSETVTTNVGERRYSPFDIHGTKLQVLTSNLDPSYTEAEKEQIGLRLSFHFILACRVCAKQDISFV